MKNSYKLHPWHGVQIGSEAPKLITAFIEIIPSDTVKYEIDKHSGYLKLDRPQIYSNIIPALYGFIPQTYCDQEVAKLCMMASGKTELGGDLDPLDILVLTEKQITHGDILVKAIPIGGFRLVDNNQADDKIIAVLKDDHLYSKWNDIKDLPSAIVNRLEHYFLTYKQMPGSRPTCEVVEIYGRDIAYNVISASQVDYNNYFS